MKSLTPRGRNLAIFLDEARTNARTGHVRVRNERRVLKRLSHKLDRRELRAETNRQLEA